MKLTEVKEAIMKEDRTPLIFIFGTIIGIPLYIIQNQYLTHLTSTDTQNPASMQDVLFPLLWIIVVTTMLIYYLLLLKRAIQHDIRSYKMKKDERETAHDFAVAKTGYVVALIGIFLLGIFGISDYQAYDGIFAGIEVNFLILLIIILRLRKRIQLDREN